jgi:hypothetical protein
MVPLTRNMQRIYLQFRALGSNLDRALRRAAQLYDPLAEQIHHTPLPRLAEQLVQRNETWDLRGRAVPKAHEHSTLADRHDLKLSTVEWTVATDDGH